MELVGSGFGDHLDLGAAVSAVDPEKLLETTRTSATESALVRRQVGDSTASGGIHAGVVNGETVGFGALAAGVNLRTVFGGERIVIGAAAACSEGCGEATSGHTRLHGEQVIKISAIERQIAHLLRFDASGDSALLGLLIACASFQIRRAPRSLTGLLYSLGAILSL